MDKISEKGKIYAPNHESFNRFVQCNNFKYNLQNRLNILG